MRSIDLVSMGFRNLWRRKLRTFLTVLGVIIGTSSIVIMVSLGFGMNESFKQEISRMGSLTVINVNPPYEYYDGTSPRVGQSATLDDKAVATIGTFKGVEAVTPVLEAYLKMISGRYVAYMPIRGIVPETMEIFEFEAVEGRLLEEGDGLNMVFGSYVPNMFYDSRSSGRFYGFNNESKVDLLKDRLEITFDMSYGEKYPGSSEENKQPAKLYKVNGVGILKEGDYQKDYNAFMSIHQLKKLVDEYNRTQRSQGGQSQQKGYQQVMVKVKDMKDVQRVQNQIKEMGFNAYSLQDYLESMQKTAASIQAVLGGIGAISLLVAALGITNTMIMSIYERTREIGIMKVIGASLRDIRRLFLLEAGIIGLSGGLVGIGFSYGASYVLNNVGARFINFMGPVGQGTRISIIPLWLTAITIVFTTIVGLISGFYPARRAMKLSALEAIKTE